MAGIIKAAIIVCAFLLIRPFHAASTNTNTLAIILVLGAPPAALGGKPFDSQAVKLAEEPLLFDRDFVHYDEKNNSFTITADSARRIAKSLIPDDNPRTLTNGEQVYLLAAGVRPFALVATGEIIYLGTFSSAASSYSLPLPTITLPLYVPADQKEPINLQIDLKNDSKTSADVRADQRIRRALARLLPKDANE